MVVRPDDPRSPARQIVDELRRMIALGDLAPGAQLPSNTEMQSRYSVSNQTAQNAISVLKNEGLVFSVPGRGVFVRSDLDQSEMVGQLAGEEEQSELYDALVARLVKLDNEQSKLSEAMAAMQKRVERIEERQGSHQGDLDQSSSLSDR